MGTGGPVIAAYVKQNTASVAAFRATVMSIFLLMNLLRCLFMGAADFMRQDVLFYASVTLPFFAIAIFLGYHAPRKLNAKTFGHVINGLLVASALSLIIKQAVPG